MRLSIQGCLILLLCSFSPFSSASYYPTITEAFAACHVRLANTTYEYAVCRVTDMSSPGTVRFLNQSWGTAGVTYSFLELCPEGEEFNTATGQCEGDPPPPPECVALSHETNPITGQTGSTNTDECSCDEGYIPGGGVPGEGQFDCVIPPQQPEECKENGQLYNPEKGYCVLECEETSLNGACLPDPEPNDDCTKDSSDYRGQVVTGYGKDPVNACGDFDQCSGDKPGQVGFMNGELRCISEDYGAPKCKGGSITVMDEYGFVCSTLENKPEEPETPEEPNTDTDNDGQPDEYQKDNDPNINRKQLDELNKSQKDANDSLANLENIGKSGNKTLKDISSGVDELVKMGKNGELGGGDGSGTGSGAGLQNDQGEDYLGDLADIKKNTKDSADNLQDIEDGLTAPEGGYGLGELLNIPTLSETATNFKNTVMGTSLAQTMDGLTGLPANTTCPVWVIPATDYWEAIPMTSHCDILEEQRSALGVIFMFFWTGIAAFTFWRA